MRRAAVSGGGRACARRRAFTFLTGELVASAPLAMDMGSAADALVRAKGVALLAGRGPMTLACFFDKLYKELYAGCLKLGRSAAQELGGDPGDTLNFMCTFSMAATLAKVCPGYLLSEIYSDSKEILKGKN